MLRLTDFSVKYDASQKVDDFLTRIITKGKIEFLCYGCFAIVKLGDKSFKISLPDLDECERLDILLPKEQCLVYKNMQPSRSVARMFYRWLKQEQTKPIDNINQYLAKSL